MKFTQVTYSLDNLLGSIEHGAIGLPEIQRPFVWKAVKVRDLFDSMYRGFPVGFLLFWKNVVEPGARTIGAADKQVPPSTLVVDGQQRLTSLYAVMRGREVITSDFKTARIQIAFRPSDEKFEVTSAAMRNNPEWVPDISEVWSEGLITFVARFIERLRNYRDVDEAEERRIGEAIQRLQGLGAFQFTALELAASLEEDQVAEIFVRINSEGVKLNQSDFILTLMSVWWDKGRKDLEEFCREARLPSLSGASPFNWFVQPSPAQLLRASIALAFGRARLQNVYSILRGKDLETETFSPERRLEQFEILERAQAQVLDLTNWHDYFRAISDAGYRGGRMVMSETNLMYTYALYLIGLETFSVDRRTLRQVIGRWFFMSSLTSRYTGSSETQMESDLARVLRLKTAEEFVAEIDRICDSVLTKDYWEIRLPNDLEGSGTRSPSLYAFDAALVLLGARALFGSGGVTDLIDPAITGKKNQVERHHLFPKGYLKTLGIEKRAEINQLANYALVEWGDNISIGASAPNEYYDAVTADIPAGELATMEALHALPDGWQHMDYWDFLEERRELMAGVIRQAWESLRSGRTPTETAADHAEPSHWSLLELLERKEGARIEFKSSARWNVHLGDKDPRLEDAVVKSVAAFMNSRGGTLVIGVADDGQVLGLEKDLTTVKGGNTDGFDLWINRLLSDRIGLAETASFVSVSFGEIDDEVVCRVDVRPASRPVYANARDRKGAFFVRTGASTQELTTAESLTYIAEHWKPGRHSRPRQMQDVGPTASRPTPIPTNVAPPAASKTETTFDWSTLHAVLEVIPEGKWTTYGDLADILGTSPQATGVHLQRCTDCASPYRVLNSSRQVAEGFRWSDPSDTTDPAALLEAEGVVFDDDRKASEHQRLTRSDLLRLLDDITPELRAEVAARIEARKSPSRADGPAPYLIERASVAVLAEALSEHGLKDSDAKSYVRLFPIKRRTWANVVVRASRVVIQVGSNAPADYEAAARELGEKWTVSGKGLYRNISDRVDHYAVDPDAVPAIVETIVSLRSECIAAIDALIATADT